MAHKLIPALNPEAYRANPDRKWTVGAALDKESAGCLLEFADHIGAATLSEAIRVAIVVAAGKNVTVSADALIARDKAMRETSQWVTRRVMVALADISRQMEQMYDEPKLAENALAHAEGTPVAYVSEEETAAAELERTNLATLKGEF